MKLRKKRPQVVTLADSLDALVKQHAFRRHPFNVAWAAGKLSQESLQVYAAQYYQRVRAFSENMKQLAARAGGPVRELIESSLAAESNATASDAVLWRQFAQSLGVTEEALEQARPLPGVAAFLDTYEEVVSQGTVAEAIAAFYVYEVQASELAAQRATGLRRFYHVDDPRALAYFEVQQETGARRAAAWRAWLASQGQGEAEAFAAICSAERCLKVIWGALDAVYPQALAISA